MRRSIMALAFRRFHAARVAVEKRAARVPAISREPLRRGPDAKIVCITASSRTAASFAASGRADSLLAAGKKAEAVAIYSHLQKTRTAPTERHVRAAAERALARAK